MDANRARHAMHFEMPRGLHCLALRWSARLSAPCYRCSLNPRVEKLVEQVGDHVKGDKDTADDQRAGDDDIHVANDKGIGQVLAEAWPAEYSLDKNRPLQHAAIGKRDNGHQLHTNVLEGVAPYDAAARNALGARSDHILLAQLFQHKLRVIRLI